VLGLITKNFRFEVLTAVKMLIFWVVTPCGTVGRYQRFRGTYRLHFQGVTAQYFKGLNMFVRHDVFTAMRI
jgi:hypothetical protein